MSRLKSSWLSLSAFAFDACAVAGAWLAAYAIRFNGIVPDDFWRGAVHSLTWVVLTYSLMFRIFGLYRGMWVFASLPDLVRISKAIVTGGLLVMIGAVMLQPFPIIPRSVLLVSPMLLFLVMGGTRALYRATKEFYLYGGLVAQGKPVLVLGAGAAGASLARELSRSAEWRLVGLLDDDPVKRGREIYGYKVLGPIGELSRFASELRAEHAIIAIHPPRPRPSVALPPFACGRVLRRWCYRRLHLLRKAKHPFRGCVKLTSRICSGATPCISTRRMSKHSYAGGSSWLPGWWFHWLRVVSADSSLRTCSAGCVRSF